MFYGFNLNDLIGIPVFLHTTAYPCFLWDNDLKKVSDKYEEGEPKQVTNWKIGETYTINHFFRQHTGKNIVFYFNPATYSIYFESILECNLGVSRMIRAWVEE